MTDLADRLEAEHRDLADLAAGYDYLHDVWSQITVARNGSDTPARGAPTSRWPAGRDPEAASRMARATVNLTIAHGWARAWSWPSKPWGGWHTAGLTVCRVCAGSGWHVHVEQRLNNDVEVVTWREPLPCLPCDESGLARHDVAALTLLPAHPNIVGTAAGQLRGYLAALAGMTLRGSDARIARLLTGASKAARLAVAPEEQDEAVEPSTPASCITCGASTDRRAECGPCRTYRSRNGRTRPAVLWAAKQRTTAA